MILALLVLPSTSTATCNDTETWQECVNRIDSELSQEYGNLVAKERSEATSAISDLSISTTGDIGVDVLGSNVSLTDLLSVFNLSLDPTSSDDSQDGSLSVSYSPTDEWAGGDFLFKLDAKKPELDEMIKEAIGNTNVSDPLAEDLDFGDDVTIHVTYSFVRSIGGKQFGRSARFYRDIRNAFAHEAAAASPSSVLTFLPALDNDLTRALNVPSSVMQGQMSVIKAHIISESDNLLRGGNVSVLNGTRLFAPCTVHTDSVALGNCVYKKYQEGIKTGVDGLVDRTRTYNQFLVDGGYYKLGELVNNQPQLLLTANARLRDELAGGDSYSIKLTYEQNLSGKNINNLDNHLRSSGCVAHDEAITRREYENCISQVTSYVDQQATGSPKWRTAFSLEYKETEDLSITLPSLPDPYLREKSKSLVTSLTFGRELNVNEDWTAGKLDVGISHDDVSDDPMRQDRTLANITFTQGFPSGFQLTAGLVWANRSEFIVDSDSELTSKIGFNYKFGKQEP